LCALGGIGGVTLRRLLAHFDSLDAILNASEGALRAVPQIGPVTARAIRSASLAQASRLCGALRLDGIDVLTWAEGEYPANLRPLDNAPPLIFVKGRLAPEDREAIALVGTRSPTPRAQVAAAHMAGVLAGRGITVVSGLALGIDRAAHQGALEADGRTLAVLGSGLRAIHPRSNWDLVPLIAAHGALLSELHPDAKPQKTSLVARDRIISGLSRLVIVVESGELGGSMRTAEFARRQGRPLAAVPGSPGTDLLLAAGAMRLDWPNVDWDALIEVARTPVETPPSLTGAPLQQPRLLERSASYPAEAEAGVEPCPPKARG
jgi:DNA processing protein